MANSDTSIPAAEESLDLLWGVNGIAAFINRTPVATYHLLKKRKLPARKVGGVWVAEKGALRQHLTESAA